MRRAIPVVLFAVTILAASEASPESFRGYAHICSTTGKLCTSEAPPIPVHGASGIYYSGTATSTVTNTATNTSTSSAVATATFTATGTASGSLTTTASATAPSTNTRTASGTVTWTQTQNGIGSTGTQSATAANNTVTLYSNITATATVTITRTVTTTGTGTSTTTDTGTATVSNTATQSFTASGTSAELPGGTITGTSTYTVSLSRTNTSVDTGTMTVSAVFPGTVTQSGTATITANGYSITATSTASGTGTQTHTWYPTSTSTSTSTSTHTATSTDTDLRQETTILVDPNALTIAPSEMDFLTANYSTDLTIHPGFDPAPYNDPGSSNYVALTPTVGSPVTVSDYLGPVLHVIDRKYFNLYPSPTSKARYLRSGTSTVRLWAKTTSAATVTFSFGTCTDQTTLTSAGISPIVLSVSGSSYAEYSGTFAIPSGGIAIPPNTSFCTTITASVTSGSPTVTIAMGDGGHWTSIELPVQHNP